MTSIEKVALWKAAAEQAKDINIRVGSHEVDSVLMVRIKGKLTKAPDQEYTPTISIPLKSALALSLHYAGVTRERAKEIMIQAMTAALNGEGIEIADYLEDVDEAMEHVKEVTESLPKQTRAGAVRHKLIMEEVELEIEEVA